MSSQFIILTIYFKHAVFVILISLELTSSQKRQRQFTWVQENDHFDFMVAISYDWKPICSAILIHYYYIATAATPFKFHGFKSGNIGWKRLKCHVVRKYWNEQREKKITRIEYQNKHYGKNSKWRGFDKQNKYGPVHDYALLASKDSISYRGEFRYWRHPYFIRLMYSRLVTIKSTGTFTICGHAFVDRTHIQQSIELEAIDYSVESVLVDCDEWVPRTWGYFICILNIEQFMGINSGAALLYNSVVVGIGSFSLARGNESVLLFTDMRKYKTYYIKVSKAPEGEMWTVYQPYFSPIF